MTRDSTDTQHDEDFGRGLFSRLPATIVHFRGHSECFVNGHVSEYLLKRNSYVGLKTETSAIYIIRRKYLSGTMAGVAMGVMIAVQSNPLFDSLRISYRKRIPPSGGVSEKELLCRRRLDGTLSVSNKIQSPLWGDQKKNYHPQSRGQKEVSVDAD